MRNLRRIVGIALAAAVAVGMACEKKESGPSKPAGGTPPAGGGAAGGAPAEPEVCGPELKAKEDAEWAVKAKLELAPKKQKVADAIDALETAFTTPLRAGKPVEPAKLEPLVAALNAARRDLGADPEGLDPLVKAAELVDRVQICRAVQADDPRVCAKLGDSAATCRGRIVQLRRLGAAMIGRKRCDQSVADAAAKIEQARDGQGKPLLTLCEAAVTGDAAKCGALTWAPHLAMCSALATGDAAACATLDEKLRASCVADAALVAGASGGVAKAPAGELPPDARVLVEAATGKAGKSACADEAARQWHEFLAVLEK